MDMSEHIGPRSAAVVTDDSCVTQVIKIVPVTRDTAGSCRNTDTKELTGPCSSALVTDESYVTQVIKMVPTTRVADGSSMTEYGNGDWVMKVEPDSLQDIKEEPKDVCYMVWFIIIVIHHLYSALKSCKGYGGAGGFRLRLSEQVCFEVFFKGV